MANAPARKSGKERVGTVTCPLSGAVCEVFQVRLGNRHAARLYYRGPGVGTIQCYGPDGQAWILANITWDEAHRLEPSKVAPEPTQKRPKPARAEPIKVAPPAAAPAAAEPTPAPAEPEDTEAARLLRALGGQR